MRIRADFDKSKTSFARELTRHPRQGARVTMSQAFNPVRLPYSLVQFVFYIISADTAAIDAIIQKESSYIPLASLFQNVQRIVCSKYSVSFFVL